MLELNGLLDMKVHGPCQLVADSGTWSAKKFERERILGVQNGFECEGAHGMWFKQKEGERGEKKRELVVVGGLVEMGNAM